jgi:UDP-N-acetylmuramoyl-L-alanyl-D-glutamate--2,6-diaminopimelate ligase
MRGTTFDAHYKGTTHPLFIHMPGVYNVYNALGVISCALNDGISMDTIAAGLQDVEFVPGRFEKVNYPIDATIILDYAHTGDGMEKMLNMIKPLAKGRIVVLFGSVGERDFDRRQALGQAAGKYADYVVITSEDPGNEDLRNICEEIADGVRQTHTNYVIIPDRWEAVRFALATYQPDDTIIFAGKAGDRYMNIKGKIYNYEEKVVVLNTLKELYG